MDDWGLVPEDDMFHPPETDDPWWTETVWYGWMVPERKMLGYFYGVFRANLGIQFGGVLLFDDQAVLPWEIPFFEYDWHMPMPEPPNLLDGTMLRGMTLKCHEPGKVFSFGLDHEDLSFDLTWEAVMQPMLTRKQPPYDFGSHIDQPGRVTGRFTLLGEDIDVDCLAMRDRSWGIRRDGRQPKIGYCYATASGDSAFLAITVERKGVDGLVRGYLMRDGVWSDLVSGARHVVRDDEGRPATITVEAVDALGRTLESTGTALSRQVFLTYPSMFCWNSLVEWDFDGQRCFGEDQDIWHPRKWRDHARQLRAAGS